MSRTFLKKNPDAMGTSTIVGTFSELNINSMGTDENLEC
jgi:hypothetical protein